MGWRVLEESGLVRLPEVDLRHFGIGVYLEAHTQPTIGQILSKEAHLKSLTSVNYVRAQSTLAVTLLRLGTGAEHGRSFLSRNGARKDETWAS